MNDETTIEAPEEQDLRTELETAYDQATPKPESSPAPSEPPVTGVAPETPPNEGAQPAVQLDEPPARLRERFGQHWAQFPPEIKQAFREYESAIGRLGNRYGQAAQQWNQLQQVFAPYEQMVKSEGGTLQTATQNLFETARILRQGHPEQRVALVMQMLPAFKIPHQQLPDGRIVLSPPTSDPRLLAQLSQLEGQRLTQQSERVHNLRNEVDSELESFLADPANPYIQIPGYAESMAVLIESGKARDLADAYQQAAWLHEESRNLEFAKRAKSEATRRGNQAQAARSAAVSVPGNAPGTLQPSTKGMSLRDELAARLEGTLE